jgi:signal transduction histidine kinase
MNPLNYIENDVLKCAWDPAPYLLFSNEVEPLVYYSHLFPAVSVMILALVVIYRNSQLLTARLFFTIATLFAIYSIFDLILWATEKPSLIMFFWSMLTYIEPLIYATMLYLVLVIIKKTDIKLGEKVLGAALLFPVIFFGPTNLNLTGFDYTNCWRLAVEGPLLWYVYFIELIFVGWIIFAITKAIYSTHKDQRKMLSLLLAGSLLFLLSFSSGNIFGTLLQDVMGEEAWVVGQYGFFGMPIFLGVLMYLMVRFKLFAARVLYAEAIVLSLFVANVSLFFVPDIETARPIILFTVLLVCILGYFLINGVRRDIIQKQEIQRLANNLEKANLRLKALDKQKSEFVSIASHQLRSPLTSIRGYASMLVEGSFGPFPVKAKEPLERIESSAKNMAVAVEDYLNVSRIESGHMKYEAADFNLKNEIEGVTDDIRPTALKQGLILLFRTDLNSKAIVNADLGKTIQIAHNLINNSIKYTPKGTITVCMRDDIKNKTILIDIIDTGIGMSQETINKIFQKFSRADDANDINKSGSGLGLFVASRMAEAMGGSITAHSKGEGEGSRFTLTLPLAM